MLLYRPESEWAVIENSHEAIVSRNDFDTVQKVLALDTRRGAEATTVSLFSGMVFCGECGASMVRKTVSAGGRQYVYYICSAHKQDKSCLPHRIRDTELEGIVLTALQSYIRQVVDLDALLDMTDTAPLRTAEAQKLQRRFDAKKTELERATKLVMSLYESLTDGILTREEYARMKRGYSQRSADAERQMNVLQEEILNLRDKGCRERPWMEQFRKYENLTELERSTVVSLIDRITIHADKRVELRYRWQDEFAWQTDLLRWTVEQEAV